MGDTSLAQTAGGNSHNTLRTTEVSGHCIGEFLSLNPRPHPLTREVLFEQFLGFADLA